MANVQELERPHHSSHRRKSGAIIVGLLTVSVIVVLLVWRDREAQNLADNQPIAGAASGIDTISSSTDAIARSIELFPPGHNPQGQIARLITKSDLDQWRGVTTPTDDPSAPIWLVGILGTNLIVDDINPSEPVGDTRAIEGIFYAWDANSGYLRGVGALGSPWPQNYLSLVGLLDKPLTIMTATAAPTTTTYPTEDPNATPTFGPDSN